MPLGIIIFLPDWIGRLRTAIFFGFSTEGATTDFASGPGLLRFAR
jgi:hypothetical protein